MRVATQTTEPVSGGVTADLEQYRRELTGYCYRMLGSAFEADDAVQETLVRAWRSADGFEGRASLRTWLYRIATNVCLDALDGRQRRARPMDLGPAAVAPTGAGPTLPANTWVEPFPDARALPAGGNDPAEAAIARETVRLAFVAALQHLPPRQRAVLILREVLRWRAREVADLLDTTVASVNSALQRARATLATRDLTRIPAEPDDAAHRALLSRYVDAFERYDLDALIALLHEDATQAMPPYPMWLQGRDEILRWAMGPGAACRGSRCLTTRANGAPAVAQYRPAGERGHVAWALHVLEMSGGRIVAMDTFVDASRLFPAFGLPQVLAR